MPKRDGRTFQVTKIKGSNPAQFEGFVDGDSVGRFSTRKEAVNACKRAISGPSEKEVKQNNLALSKEIDAIEESYEAADAALDKEIERVDESAKAADIAIRKDIGSLRSEQAALWEKEAAEDDSVAAAINARVDDAVSYTHAVEAKVELASKQLRLITHQLRESGTLPPAGSDPDKFIQMHGGAIILQHKGRVLWMSVDTIHDALGQRELLPIYFEQGHVSATGTPSFANSPVTPASLGALTAVLGSFQFVGAAIDQIGANVTRQLYSFADLEGQDLYFLPGELLGVWIAVPLVSTSTTTEAGETVTTTTGVMSPLSGSVERRLLVPVPCYDTDGDLLSSILGSDTGVDAVTGVVSWTFPEWADMNSDYRTAMSSASSTTVILERQAQVRPVTGVTASSFAHYLMRIMIRAGFGDWIALFATELRSFVANMFGLADDQTTLFLQGGARSGADRVS